MLILVVSAVSNSQKVMSEENLEDTSSVKMASNEPPQTNLFLPVALGVAGILIGIVSLYMAFHVNKRISASGDVMDKKIANVARVNGTISELEGRINALKTQLAKQTEQIDDLISQTQSAFVQVGKEIGSTRSQVTKNADKIRELVENMTKPVKPVRAVAKAAPAKASSSGVAAPLSDGQMREHVIASGDTFSKLAAQYHVTTDAILAANPDVDPRRLQIGQKIMIPASK